MSIILPNTIEEASQIMKDIMVGKYTTSELVEFLTSYQLTPPNKEIMNAFLEAVKQSAVYLLNAGDYNKPMLDIAGTGGDGKSTVNISTLSAIVSASTGLVITAKYGNRSASGICGSMDVLENAGINIELEKEELEQQLKEHGFAPIYARAVYPGGKFVADARNTVDGPTIFNILFPLARPVTGNVRFVFGIAKKELIPEIEKLYLLKDNVRCILVRGIDGIDEVSVSGIGETMYSLIDNKKSVNGVIDCKEVFGISPIDLSLLQIETKQEAVSLFLDTINPAINNDKVDAIRKAVIANTSVALFVALDNGNMDITDAGKYVDVVKNSIETGKAMDLVNKLKY